MTGKLEPCPVCDGSGQIHLGYGYANAQKRWTIFEISDANIITEAEQCNFAKRCPICYSKGKVSEALNVAFNLVFGNDTILIYTELSKFRLNFNKGAQ
jgi:hypothetical protein